MKNESQTLINVVKNIEAKRYNSTELGRRLMGTAVAMTPQTSQEALSTIIPLIVSAAITDAGLPCSLEKVADSAPCKA